MKLARLLKALPTYTLDIAHPDYTDHPPSPVFMGRIGITRITADSRAVEPGTLFVAYRGVSVDGHRYLPDAIQRGAVALVVEAGPLDPHLLAQAPAHLPVITVPDGREALAYFAAAWHAFPARKLRMVGITGTDGKTTTTNFLYHMLRDHHVSMINTVSAVIGSRTLETGLHTTTPDALDVQRYLAEMVAAHTDICLLEATSHGLAQHRVTACDFDIAIVTNITHEHLDVHGSLEGYWNAKAMLFESLAVAADKGWPKTAILNCDDSSFDFLRARLGETPWLGYSLTGHADATVTAQDICHTPDSTRFTIQGPGYRFGVETPLVGDYNISNCLAAATAALELLDVTPEQVQAGVAALRGIPGRMERIHAGQPFLAIVDFAHTPNALRRALTVARTLVSGRVIAVFGCAGLRDVEKRTMMGRIAAELADLTLITAEDPRTESLDAIIAETAQAMLTAGATEGHTHQGHTFERIPDRGRAIYRAVQLAQPNDVVIVLGKGHEQSMCFGTVEYPWDDRHALRTALQGAPLLTLPSA